MPRPALSVRISLLSAIAAACGGGGEGGPAAPPPPPPPSVATVALSQDTATLVPSVTVQLSATARDAAGNALSRTITWSSSDESKARVSTSGLVTGVSLGSATITASADGRSAQARIAVKDGAIVSGTGAAINALAGTVTLDVPPGAFAANTMVTIDNAASPPAEPRLVGGTAIEIAAPTPPSLPLTLRLRYRTDRIPAGPPERLLALYRAQSGTWQAVQGTLDLPNKLISAPIPTLGIFGILTPPFVAAVSLSQTTVQMRAGDSLTLVATARDAGGAVLPDRDRAWTSSDPTIATVGASSGIVTGVSSGTATITANIEGKTASASINVVEPVASVTFTSAALTVDVWADAQLSVTLRDRRNNVLTGRAISWQSSNSSVATVDNAGLVSGFSAGQAVVTATSEGISATTTVTVPTLPPLQISAVAPATLTRGIVATITGSNFGRRLTDNAVSVAGVTAVVTNVTRTQLTISLPAAGLPCQTNQNVAVAVARAGSPTATAQHPLSVSVVRSLQLGESLMLSSSADLTCNEIVFGGGHHYLLAITNANTTPSGTAGFELRSATATNASTDPLRTLAVERAALESGPVYAPLSAGPLAARAAAGEAARAHDRLLELNQSLVRRLGAPRHPPRSAVARDAAGRARPPLNRTLGSTNALRYPDLAANDPCNTFIGVTARTAAVGQRAIILEDVASPTAGMIDNYYQQIVQQFDATMWPILTGYFGNPLAMDAQLDNDGQIVMLFTSQINALPGVNGFVIACDFYPEAQSASSNRGEIFYARVPTSASGTSSNSAAAWFWSIRSTIIHEVKHLTAYAERFSRAGSGSVNLEQSFLEEGTARHSEEIWARTYSGTTWRGNTTYTSGVWCDFRMTFPQCGSKALAMSKHFDGLWDFLFFMGDRSPLGRTSSSDISFYGSSWSFVRWLIDHYATSEQAFLSALVQDASRTGVANLEARAGRPFAELLMRWAVANWADDRSGITVSDPTGRHPSWQTRDVFSGLFSDLPSVYPFSSPIASYQPTQGAWQVRDVISGGSYAFVRVQGSQTVRQMLELRSSSSATIPASLRMIMVRVQ